MTPNLRIAFRFLTAKKRAMLMSLSCTVLGVGLFIVTQATTSGFEQFFIRTILGTDGAIRIEDRIQDTMRSTSAGNSRFQYRQKEGVKYIEGVDEPAVLIRAIKDFAEVRGASEVLRGSVLVTSSFKSEDAQVIGINLDDHLRVSDLKQQVVAGSLEPLRDSPTAAVVGQVLADRLQLSIGDSFTMNAHGEIRRYVLVGTYATGSRDIDKLRIYIELRGARSLLRKASGASLIQVSLVDPERAPVLAAQMESILGYKVRPWQEREVTWLSVFHALRISSAITVTVFTIIAGLAMFNTLAMIVMEKTKDIAILRSMGYERTDVTQIFLWQAGIVLAVGSVLGAAFGAGVTWCVEHVPLHIEGIFNTEHFIVAWEWQHYLYAVLTAVLVVMIASVIPARRAARLEPGDVIRGSGA